MNEVTVTNFRCFAERQTACLAPLTLLVGENSTGKTSFLALIRALCEVAFRERIPDFKEPPYDLGAFDDIVHFRGHAERRLEKFEAGCSMGTMNGSGSEERLLRWDCTFRRYGSGVRPSVRRIAMGSVWVECEIAADGSVSIGIGTSRDEWKFTPTHTDVLWRWAAPSGWASQSRDLPSLRLLIHILLLSLKEFELGPLFKSHGKNGLPGAQDLEEISELCDRISQPSLPTERSFSSAPVRSRPRRTYDTGQTIPDPEGEYVPRLLATMARDDAATWSRLKKSLEKFGKEAGLFDEIKIKELGGTAGGPFQVRVKKWGRDAEVPDRNLIDMGYGLSQVLPVVVDLLRHPVVPQIFLLQQPEVHLHPSAQAALGGLLLRVAPRAGQPVIVETHSDHLIDRIRMDIRDDRIELGPDDVSILYFERDNLSVTIHSLGWDDNGNLVAKRGSIPDSYRQFFRTERRRSLGL